MSFFRAAWVIARRDFSAVVFSRAFILFLIGPMVIFGFVAGASIISVGVSQQSQRIIVGVSLPGSQADKLRDARTRLAGDLGEDLLPELRVEQARDGAALLANGKSGLNAVLSGTLEQPVLTGKDSDLKQFGGGIGLMIATARAGDGLPPVRLERHVVAQSQRADQRSQLETARFAQTGLFLLTVLLAGMVLSNMVEEKTNKIIEILAAAIPIDAIFVGKLAAMLAMSLVGIACWGTLALGALLLTGGGVLPDLPAPALGWPVFSVLAVTYFALTYTLLGALFISIGAQASTVREVQTLSMPVTMSNMLFFFLATFAVASPGSPLELFACAFPFSSPFAMIARAAQSPLIWPHVAAILWQGLWIAVIIRLGVRLFRRNVFKSRGTAREKRGLFRRRAVGVVLEAAGNAIP